MSNRRKRGIRTRTAVATVVAAGLLVQAAAHAQATPSYPEPSNPGKVAPKPKGKGKTRTVCRARRTASSRRSSRP